MKRSFRNFAWVTSTLSLCALGTLSLCLLGVFGPLTLSAFAVDAAPVAGAPGGSAISPFQFIFSTVQFFLIGFFVYFWLAIRPGQLREDERKKFLKDLKKNDDVMTSGGVFGKVLLVKDDSVTIDVGAGVKLRVHVDHIQMLPPALAGSENAVSGLRLQAPAQKASE